MWTFYQRVVFGTILPRLNHSSMIEARCHVCSKTGSDSSSKPLPSWDKQLTITYVMYVCLSSLLRVSEHFLGNKANRNKCYQQGQVAGSHNLCKINQLKQAALKVPSPGLPISSSHPELEAHRGSMKVWSKWTVFTISKSQSLSKLNPSLWTIEMGFPMVFLTAMELRLFKIWMAWHRYSPRQMAYSEPRSLLNLSTYHWCFISRVSTQ